MKSIIELVSIVGGCPISIFPVEGVNQIEVIVFLITQYNSDIYNAHILTPINRRVQTYMYEYLRKLSRQIFNIDKVTIDALLLVGTSRTTKKHTKKHTLLNPIKNLLLQKSKYLTC